MVGYNRRFAPMAVSLQQHFTGVHPLSIHYRVNAGTIPAEHWLSDPAEGGRIIGEACHFFDFFAFLTGSTPESVDRLSVDRSCPDDVQMLVTYADGSVCHLTYTTTGAKATSKERVEVFGGGRSGLLDDFRSLQLDTGSKRVLNQRSWFSGIRLKIVSPISGGYGRDRSLRRISWTRRSGWSRSCRRG